LLLRWLLVVSGSMAARVEIQRALLSKLVFSRRCQLTFAIEDLFFYTVDHYSYEILSFEGKYIHDF
jgi:hypothetical protein